MMQIKKVQSRGSFHPHDNLDTSPEVTNEGTQVRRSERVRAPSRRYPTSNYILLTSEGEPESFQEAQSHIDKANWQKAMEEEMNYLQKNQTYELVKLPKGKKALKNKWVFQVEERRQGKYYEV